jgi:hypothetical protein
MVVVVDERGGAEDSRDSSRVVPRDVASPFLGMGRRAAVAYE